MFNKNTYKKPFFQFTTISHVYLHRKPYFYAIQSLLLFVFFHAARFRFRFRVFKNKKSRYHQLRQYRVEDNFVPLYST